ncbi:hypothetical protein BV898_01214 [Hypsibius exemplaris]|uniref:Receptor ligand binding region domain-containing protein n=1 Tax=Hypsibius exemplaris TaxID=2072580 RepID=A0A1W0XBX7_HYPEX|nr:hypothetical protein BV898_01214 [Hypsibius exemplaris]
MVGTVWLSIVITANLLIAITNHCLASATGDIVILTTLPYEIGVAPDIKQTGAAFDLAAENMTKFNRDRNLTGSMTVKYLFDASTSSLIRSCGDVAGRSAQLLAEYRYRQTDARTCYAIVTSPIAASGTFLGYSTVLLEILRYYKWYRATILVEIKAIATFYRDLASLILDRIKILLPETVQFQMERFDMDATISEGVTSALIFARSRSRVIILLATGITARAILEKTGSLEMSNGEYVFIIVQPLEADVYGQRSQFQHSANDTNLNAFRSLLFVAFGSFGNSLDQLNAKIRSRAKTVYNTTLSAAVEPLDSYAIQTSHAIVELFATVCREMDSKGGSNCSSGLATANHVRNKSFHLSTGALYIDSAHIRNLDLLISGFNSSTRVMQSIGTYSWSSRKLIWDTERAIDWPTVDGQPPRDVPLCGFSGDQGICAEKAMSKVLTPSAVTTVSLLLISAITGFILRWRSLARHGLAGGPNPADWWRLDQRPTPHPRNSSAVTLPDTRSTIRGDINSNRKVAQ